MELVKVGTERYFLFVSRKEKKEENISSVPSIMLWPSKSFSKRQTPYYLLNAQLC